MYEYTNHISHNKLGFPKRVAQSRAAVEGRARVLGKRSNTDTGVVPLLAGTRR